VRVLKHFGWHLFSLALIALGVETVLFARSRADSLGFSYRVIPVIPWLPAIPWLAYACGVLLVMCGAGLQWRRTARLSALAAGSYLLLGALLLSAPRYSAHPGNMSLRTTLFEPLALAAIAFLLPQAGEIHSRFLTLCRYVIAVSLIVFGADHLIAVQPIAKLIPSWIVGRPFWVAFFGVAFICAAISIWLKLLESWAWLGVGLMFGIWVCTLHLPRVLGLYGIPGAPQNPNEWQSLFIAIAFWGGSWALSDPGIFLPADIEPTEKRGLGRTREQDAIDINQARQTTS